MEHPCYQCGQPVEEGSAFCANCHAPQIRVGSQAAPDESATPPLRPGTPDDVQPPANPVHFEHHDEPQAAWRAPAPPPPNVSASPIHWGEALPGALVAGIVIALASIVPLAGFLLWPMAAGAFAVLLYLRRRPEQTITAGLGARVGAIAGLFGFAAFAIIIAISVVGNRGGQFRETLQQILMQAAARNPNPEAQAIMQRMMTPEGIGVILAFSAVVMLGLFVAFSAIGGAVGANLLRKRDRR